MEVKRWHFTGGGEVEEEEENGGGWGVCFINKGEWAGFYNCWALWWTGFAAGFRLLDLVLVLVIQRVRLVYYKYKDQFVISDF